MSCVFLAAPPPPPAASSRQTDARVILPQIIIFSTTTAYMFGAAGFCVYKAVEQSGDSLIMAQIVVSLVSTYGVYVLASIIALDPWHIVTSMVQYMLLAPLYINLLAIYANSNLHDFSWGSSPFLDVCGPLTFRADPDPSLQAPRSRTSRSSTSASPAKSARTRSTWPSLRTRPTLVRLTRLGDPY